MTSPDAIAFHRHDHSACAADGLAAARNACLAQKLRLTPARERVLEILLESHRALGAYEILERLKDEGLGSQPPIAYRALDFLVAHGFAHKIERLNAFIACSHPGEGHDPAFMICRTCDKVAEAATPPAGGALGRAARAAGFDIERTVVEAEGLCPDCQEAGPK